MKWNRFCQMLIEAEQTLEQITLDLPQYQSFLKQSSLIISFGTIQVSFKKELTVFDLKSMFELLTDSDYKDNLVCLNNLLDRLEEEQKVMVKLKIKEGLKDISEIIARVKYELCTFPIQELSVHDGIDIEMIFPSVHEAIQVIKKHPLTNKKKVCFCRACIRVFIQ